MGARVMAANRLANNSQHWYEVFSQNNSGTGNKQWLVISANRTAIEFGVVEQMPGIVTYDELSNTLLSTSYWVSSSYPCLKVSFFRKFILLLQKRRLFPSKRLKPVVTTLYMFVLTAKYASY